MKRIFGVFVLGVIMVSSVAFTACQKEDKVSINNKEKVKSITMPKEKDNAIDLDLYFDSSTDEKKVEIAKEERLIQKEELLGELIMQELIKGPSVESKLKPILPKETRLLSFSIKDSIAYVNLSNEAKVSMTKSKEEASLKSIVNSLTQLPSVVKIKLLIDSKEVDTLGGNYDISKPFGKDDIDARKK